MRVDLMLADYAMVHSGKLFISGAGINFIRAEPSAERCLVAFGIGMTIILSQDEGDRNHRLLISITDAEGENVELMKHPPEKPVPAEDAGKIIADFNFKRQPGLANNDGIIIPLAFQFAGLTMPRVGTYTVRVEVDGIELASQRFRVQIRMDPSVEGLALADP